MPDLLNQFSAWLHAWRLWMLGGLVVALIFAIVVLWICDLYAPLDPDEIRKLAEARNADEHKFIGLTRELENERAARLWSDDEGCRLNALLGQCRVELYETQLQLLKAHEIAQECAHQAVIFARDILTRKSRKVVKSSARHRGSKK
jgi:hypothetical protein